MPRFTWDYPQRLRNAVQELREFVRTTRPQEVVDYLNPFPSQEPVHARTETDDKLDSSTNRELKHEQRRYKYLPQNLVDNPLSPIAVAGKIPLTEFYDLRWAVPYLPTLVVTVADVKYKLGKFCIDKLLGRFDQMLAYRELFSRFLPIPDYAESYHLDSEFGRLRVEGPNPVMLERLATVGDVQTWFPGLNDQLLRQALDLETVALAQAVNENRLYICNYTINQDSLLPKNPNLNRDSRWRTKYLPAPRVLFYDRDVDVNEPDRRELFPVAIYLDQSNAAKPNPLYVRGNERKWTYAKTFAQAADLNTQVLSSHIYRCHFVAEPFALSTPRHLVSSHPLNILLEPHLRYTLTVNDQAFKLLKVRGKVFDNIYAGTIAETREIMIQSYQKWTFRDLAPERDFAKRGVTEFPKHYPYRDDILLYWPVIQAFVADYLALYYPKNTSVQTDIQLQRWIDELVDPQKGNIRGLLTGPRLETVEELAEILTILLFTAGPQHASVHFPQSEYFTFIPGYPGAPYMPPTEDPTSLPPQQLLESLPPIDRAAEQFQTNQIGNYRFDRFGHYEHYRLGRVQEAAQAIAKLQAGLDQITATITSRNQTRPHPYTYLLPKNVPNSINI